MSDNDEQGLVRQGGGGLLSLSPVMDLQIAKARLKEFQAFVAEYLVEGINDDYGKIPGTPKATLLKPGADKLCELYGLADTYTILEKTADWDRDLFEYEILCRLINKRDGSIVSEGMGCCNSFEGKYRWRDSKRVCPRCGQEAIIKGKEEYGGGGVCFEKKGGCKAKFKDGDQAIEGQTIGRVENDDVATMKNTIMKMAKKRAKIDAVISATRSSGIFTQDVEDMQEMKAEAHAAVKAEESFQLIGTLKKLMAHECITSSERDTFDRCMAGDRTEKELDAAIGKIGRKIAGYEKEKAAVAEASTITIQSDEIPEPAPKRRGAPKQVDGFKTVGALVPDADITAEDIF